MNKQKKKEESWEKEFNDKFTLTSKRGKAFIGYTIAEEELIIRIKSFIHSLLAQRDKELIEEIEKMKKTIDLDKQSSYPLEYYNGWNNAVKYCLSLLLKKAG